VNNEKRNKAFLNLNFKKEGKTMETIRMKKTIMVLGVIFFALVLFSSEALPWGSGEAVVKIMTQNIYAGTSLGFALAFGAPEGVDLTLGEIQASNIPQRADLLARKIAREQPHMVALQEVTLWRTGPTPETATHVLYDQLKLLLRALARHGAPYDIVAVNILTDLALPGSQGALRYTDRDALLVRSDLRRPTFQISNTETHIYDAAFDFGELPVVHGWISADVQVGHSRFRLVVTHLMSPVPGVPDATDVQVAQATELIQTLHDLTIPVVLCGDFNSDANFGDGPDATPSVGLFEAAGYEDTWKIANPSDRGDTWPLFLDDQFPPPPYFSAPYPPFERIDLFFSRNIQVIRAKRVFAPAPFGSVPPYASDHAGVIATFALERFECVR
jgi:endonuclease/exonuclease/phosphatase family metal-dependent hydrolase